MKKRTGFITAGIIAVGVICWAVFAPATLMTIEEANRYMAQESGNQVHHVLWPKSKTAEHDADGDWVGGNGFPLVLNKADIETTLPGGEEPTRELYEQVTE